TFSGPKATCNGKPPSKASKRARTHESFLLPFPRAAGYNRGRTTGGLGIPFAGQAVRGGQEGPSARPVHGEGLRRRAGVRRPGLTRGLAAWSWSGPILGPIHPHLTYLFLPFPV